MMSFVLGHGAEPFPGSDFGAAGSFTFFLEVVVGELREELQRFGMEAVEEGHDFVEGGAEFLAVGSVAAGATEYIFGPHVALGDGKMAEEIAESEMTGRAGPIDFVGRDAAGDAESTLADVAEILQEGLDGANFHDGLASWVQKVGALAWRTAWP